jgi:hypothetical protein
LQSWSTDTPIVESPPLGQGQAQALPLFDQAALDAAIQRTLTQIRPGRSGFIRVGATLRGARLEGGLARGRVQLAGWAERTWGHAGWATGVPGWSAGAQATVEF